MYQKSQALGSDGKPFDLVKEFGHLEHNQKAQDESAKIREEMEEITKNLTVIKFMEEGMDQDEAHRRAKDEFETKRKAQEKKVPQPAPAAA